VASSVRRPSVVTVNPDQRGLGTRFNPADTSVETRIGSNVQPQPNGCWHWGDGSWDYPTVKLHGRTVVLHRWLYFQLHPELDPDDWSDHHLHHDCENPRCVNPAHLLLLTPAEHKARHKELSGTT
jgi:hypothetical protein